MKIIYQGKEVGLQHSIKRVIDMFGESIRISPKHIMACKCNNEIKSLDYEIKDGDTVELIDLTTKDGVRIYIRGVLYIMSMAFNELFPDSKLMIDYQLSNSMFCELQGEEITNEMIEKVREKMNEIVENDYPIKKVTMTKEEAEKFYKKDKRVLTDEQRGTLQIENKDKDEVTLYFCENYFNYFYGVMPISTGYINVFDIKKYKNGFIVRYPNRHNPGKLGEFKESKKFLSTLQEYEQIYNLMQVSTVKQLNDAIRAGKGNDIILASEALQEKKLAEMADKIAKKKGIKIVLIAGPSSSGKTTFAKRLGTHLKVNGLKPVTIGTDNYFVERKDTPRDENGEYDFETIDALDLNLFNEHLTRLINGETVEIPVFDFKDGTKRYDGTNMLHLDEDEILIIEGIHCLNDKLTSKIPRENKFKIYISDLTVLNIDYYNRISTTDTRLIRRIVRDHNFRSYSALDTLTRWPSVNSGESKNIFPYQEEADAMFNSSLVYELAVLGKYARPLLKEIDKTKPEYSEAKRLTSFLEYFDEIDEEAIPNNSLLREFIGGSIFGD